jgi:hypothetical protein
MPHCSRSCPEDFGSHPDCFRTSPAVTDGENFFAGKQRRKEGGVNNCRP